MKKKYEKPLFRVVELQHDTLLLTRSGDPKRNVPWWDGEGDARRHRGDWDDSDDWDEEDE